MHIVILVLILLVLALLAQKQPKSALILGLVLAGAGLLVILLTSSHNFRQQRIAVEDIMLTNTAMLPTYAGGYKLTGRLINKSETATLKTTMVSVKMLDCPNQQIDDSCLVVGHINERIDDVVPPGQARGVDETLNFGRVKIEHNLRWQFDITESLD